MVYKVRDKDGHQPNAVSRSTSPAVGLNDWTVMIRQFSHERNGKRVAYHFKGNL